MLQIPIGSLSDRFGFKSFIVGGYVLCGLTGFLYFLADTPNLFFAGRFFQGIAEVPIWALAPALLSIQYASEKGKFMGMYNASLHCGLTVGGLISIIAFRIPESLKGTISGAFYFFWGMGYFFGPLLIGKFDTSIGFHTGFSFFSGLLMLHLMALSLVVKGGHRART